MVLRGGRGTGKGVVARAIGRLFGQHFVHVSHARHLTGNFNAHLAECVLLFVDEAFWAGDKQGEAQLKRMITEDGFEELMQLAILDALASSSYLGFYHLCRRALDAMGAVETRPPPLIGGNDLIALGFKPGPAFKEILREVEDLHLDGSIATREEALAYVVENHSPATVAE